MLKRLMTGLLSGLIAVLLPACDRVTLEKLKPGQTTMQQTREIMGPPTMEWQDPDGSITLEYPRTPNSIVNYMIDFGPNEILRKVRQVLAEENFAKVKEGMIHEEIRRLLERLIDEPDYKWLMIDASYFKGPSPCGWCARRRHRSHGPTPRYTWPWMRMSAVANHCYRSYPSGLCRGCKPD